jgi:hypothetical protein
MITTGFRQSRVTVFSFKYTELYEKVENESSVRVFTQSKGLSKQMITERFRCPLESLSLGSAGVEFVQKHPSWFNHGARLDAEFPGDGKGPEEVQKVLTPRRFHWTVDHFLN